MLNDRELTQIQETGSIEIYTDFHLGALESALSPLGIELADLQIHQRKNCVQITVVTDPPVMQELTYSPAVDVSSVEEAEEILESASDPRAFVVSSSPAVKGRATQETVDRLKAEGAPESTIAIVEESLTWGKNGKRSLWKRIFG